MSTAFETSSRHDSIELLVIPESGVVFSNHPLQSNKVTTTKYTWYNFLPLNLWQQLTTLANLYFIFIGILQTLSWTTTSNGIPTILTPLTTITVISGGRAAIENYHASQSDEKRNSQLFWQIVAKNPQLFQNQLKLAASGTNKSGFRDQPLLALSPGGGEVDSGGQAPLMSHPQSILHLFYQRYAALPSKVRRRWSSWQTRSASEAVNLPGLDLQPQQAKYAFHAMQPQKQGLFSSLFNKSTSDLFSPSLSQPHPSDSTLSPSQSLLPEDQFSSLPNSITSDASGLHSPSSPTLNDATTANTNAVLQRRNLLESNSTLDLVQSGDLKPGTILKVYQGQAVPADMILLGSSNARGHCFIDKANLNGETQLEVMNAIPYLKPYFGHVSPTTTSSPHSSTSAPAPTVTSSHSHAALSPAQGLTLRTGGTEYGAVDSSGNLFETISTGMADAPYYDIDLHLRYDLPNADFEQFRGVMSVYSHSKPHLAPVNISLSAKQLLLRETVLRNTDYIYGLVVYTGDDTKIRRSIVEEMHSDKKSTSGPQIKESRLMAIISRLVAILFVTQIVMCLVAGVTYSLWVWQNATDHWYLRLSPDASETMLGALFTSLSWMISLNTFVPISLLVTMEMTRFMTSIFVEWDLELFDPVINRPTKANTSTIHDDLGKVDLICSDKTGTLTRNQQEMRYLSIAIHDGLPGTSGSFGPLTNSGSYGSSGVHKLVDFNTFQAITKASSTDLDAAQKQWKAKAMIPGIEHFVQPIGATMAFEAFGSMQTEIAAKVKSKTSKTTTNLLKANITTKDGMPLPYFKIPPTHPVAYQGLPPRWTQSLVEAGIIQPLRPIRDPSDRSPAVVKQWKLAQLMSNAYKHNNPFFQRRLGSQHTDNKPLTRKSYSLFSHLWNTAQGHAYYQWFLSLQQAQGLKLAREEAEKAEDAGAEKEREQETRNDAFLGRGSLSINSSDPNSPSQSLSISTYPLGSSRSSHSTTPSQPLYTQLDTSTAQSQGSNRAPNTNANTTTNTNGVSVHVTRPSQSQHASNHLSYSTSFRSPTPSPSQAQPNHHPSPRSSTTSISHGQNHHPASEMTLFAQHGSPARLDESQAFISEPPSDEPPLISTFGTSKSLHRLASSGYLAPNPQQGMEVEPFRPKLSASNDPNNKAASQIPTISPTAYPPGPRVYSRLSFEKDYYLPLTSVLGSFRGDSRTAILTALWSKNWAHLPQYQNEPIYIAPYHIRQHLFRYIRSMALSSTVKAYRKPDGTLDWQFESAEELAMTKFAAALGFYRDVHPSGEGIVLYIREYFSPNFDHVDLEPSWKKIQADGYHDLDPDTTDLPSNGHHSTPPTASHLSSSAPTRDQHGAREFTPAQVKKHSFKKFQSKIHAETYNSLGVCGFSSARARVSVILQRSPQVTFPLQGSFTPQRTGPMPQFDTNECLEGYWTTAQYSTYFSEYDRQFRNQSHLPIKIHPFDLADSISQADVEYEFDAQQCLSYGQYPDAHCGLVSYLNYLDSAPKNHIHVLTKGQDVTTIPLIKDIVASVGDAEGEGFGGDLGVSSFFNSTAQTQRNPTKSSIPYTNPHHSLKAQLYEMENASLRCLVSAYSELPNEWWSQYEHLFSFVSDLDVDTHLPVQNLSQLVQLMNQYPNMSPNDIAAHLQNQPTNSIPSPTSAAQSQGPSLKAVEIRHLTYQAIEESASLALLGCFGMEDQLQVLVPETIRDMRRAGIRVWMITGDKLDVAKNIALACELIDPDMLGSGNSSVSVAVAQGAGQGQEGEGLHHSVSNWGSFARFDSNLVTINNPELFPLCIRQFPSSRLINITGEWLLNFRTNKTKLLLDTFTALTEYDESKNVLVEIGYLQQCLLHVGLDLTLAQLGSLFLLDISEIPTFITNVTATTTISRDRFVQAMTLIGESISDRDSIIIDIETGLKVYESLHAEHNGDASQMPPIALLVNRNAFNLMFQDDNEAEEAQYEFHEKRQELLFQKTAQSTPTTTPTTTSPTTSPTATSSSDGLAMGYVTPHSPVSTQSNRPYLIKEDARQRKERIKKSENKAQLPWLSQKFFALALFAKSVVFARAEPAMKKKMVTATKALFPTATTLAIGDGANDTDMITAAHIGIGIAGVEGTAASNSADYAIGTFRMLHRLLLVHGLTNDRIEKIILLMFYKGSMVAICHYFYGFHSSFSGASLFVDLLYQCYNTIYTSWCVLLLIQHQPVPATVLQNSPALYREMNSNSFTLSRFVFWLAKSLVHALVIFYVPLLPFFFEGNDIMGGLPLEFEAADKAFEGFRGRPFSLDHVSTLQICALAILPNLVSFFMMESIQFPFFSIVMASAMSIFGCVVAISYSRWSAGNLFLDFTSLFSNPQFWLMLFLILAIPILSELTLHYFQYYWVDFPGIMQLVKERVYLRQKETRFIDRNFTKHQKNQKQNRSDGYQLFDPSNHTPHSNYHSTDHTNVVIGQEQARAVHRSSMATSQLSQQNQQQAKSKNNITFTLASSTTSSAPPSTGPDSQSQSYIITQTPYDDIASTPENVIDASLDVQLKGCDPDPTALFSSHLWSEAAGYGVRATQAEEIIVANPYFNPNDKMNALTGQAEALLRKLSHHDPIDVFIPTCIELELGSRVDQPITTVVQQSEALIAMGFHSYQSDVLSRTMALKVFRLLSLLTQSQDTDQQQQQNQSSAQARAAMQKRGAAFYKRDRFLSSAAPPSSDNTTTKHSLAHGHNSPLQQHSDEPIIINKTAKKQFVLNSKMSAQNNNNNNSGNVDLAQLLIGGESVATTSATTTANALSGLDLDEITPLSRPILHTSDASAAGSVDGDRDDDAGAVDRDGDDDESAFDGLGRDLVPIASNLGLDSNVDDDGDEGDGDDDGPVTVSTAQTLFTNVKSDHFDSTKGQNKTNNCKGGAGKRRK